MFPKKASTIKIINIMRININPKKPNIPNIVLPFLLYYLTKIVPKTFCQAFFLVRSERRMYQRMMAANPLMWKMISNGMHTSKNI